MPDGLLDTLAKVELNYGLHEEVINVLIHYIYVTKRSWSKKIYGSDRHRHAGETGRIVRASRSLRARANGVQREKKRLRARRAPIAEAAEVRPSPAVAAQGRSRSFRSCRIRPRASRVRMRSGRRCAGKRSSWTDKGSGCRGLSERTGEEKQVLHGGGASRWNR